MRVLHDLSPVLGVESCAFPGDPPFAREVVRSWDGGSAYELSALRMSAHAGAHVDAPAHFFEEGKRIGDYPASRFVLPVVVLDAGDAVLVGAEVLDGVSLPTDGGLLFRTRNSAEGLPRAGRTPGPYVGLSAAAAERCVALGARLVGIDAISIDAPMREGFPAHMALLGADVLVLEGIDLRDVAPGAYTLSALPLAVPDAEGAPVRAVLLGP